MEVLSRAEAEEEMMKKPRSLDAESPLPFSDNSQEEC